MTEWVVKFKPVKVVAMTKQGAYDAALNMLESAKTSSENAHIAKNVPLEPFKGTYEYYESMLDHLQGQYGEYLMDLTPDEVNHMMESGQMFLDEEDIYG